MNIRVFTIIMFLPFFIWAQNDTTSVKEKAKTGFSFGVVPAIAYDSDIGFKYGGLTNIYYYGDGSTYPKYLHSLYLEWSRTTKGSGINQIIYDSEYLIPKTRVTLEASYLTEKALDFFGFNGYPAVYHSEYIDDASSNIDYISRMYYKYERSQLKLKADFQSFLWEKKLRALIGFTHFDTRVDQVDIDNLNEGKKENLLPDTAGLYEKYVDWGIISQNEKNGGKTEMLRLGLVFDTRDQEGNPMKGVWSEVLLLMAPSFDGVTPSYAKLALTHRQYFTLKKEVLGLAYRVSYQPKIYGTIPFYMLPYVYNSNINRDGLGGAKTLRGILRNRVVGDDVLYGNIEARWKFFRRIVFNQNLYLGLTGFVDAGMVTGKYDFDTTVIPEEAKQDIIEEQESIHGSYGLGFTFVLNHNFIVSINYGRAIDPRDGKSGLYIGLNYLF
ncbi:MAG: BamA/TamA family outer membrane protein [Bacteroidales bacterium]|nr:BamA/TamA family outer membrane protein [Bacteroidales bacterium]